MLHQIHRGKIYISPDVAVELHWALLRYNHDFREWYPVQFDSQGFLLHLGLPEQRVRPLTPVAADRRCECPRFG